MAVNYNVQPARLGQAFGAGQAQYHQNQALREQTDMAPMRRRMAQLGVRQAEQGVQARDIDFQNENTRRYIGDAFEILKASDTGSGFDYNRMTELATAKANEYLNNDNPLDDEAGKNLQKLVQMGPQTMAKAFGGLVQRGMAEGALQPPSQAAQTSMQQKEVNVDGTPSIVSFNPKTGQYFDTSGRSIEGSRITPTERSGQKIEVNLPAGEGKLTEELAKGRAEILIARQELATDARESLKANAEASRLLDSGMITGFGAGFLTNLGSALNQMGISLAEDAVENTQAFGAVQAKQVAKIIKAFGSGTGLSDADREFAIKAAGGDVSMNEGAIRRVIDVNNRAYRNAIEDFNKAVEKLPDSARAMMDIIDIPDIPELKETESAEDRIQTLATFNRGYDAESMPFDSPAEIRSQLKSEGYAISNLTDEKISSILISAVQPKEEQSSTSYREGQTARNPNTGEVLIYRSGEWVPQDG